MVDTLLRRVVDGTRLLLLAAVVAIAVIVIAMSNPIRQVGPAEGETAPETAAQACQAPANAEKGGSTLTFSWQMAAEVDRPEGSALLFVSGTNTLLCQVRRTADGRVGTVVSSIGGHPEDTRAALTIDGGAEAPGGGFNILDGRVPAGTVAVRLTFGDGSRSAAAVGAGNYLAWLETPGAPVQIEALDANGRLLQQLADPSGLGPS